MRHFPFSSPYTSIFLVLFFWLWLKMFENPKDSVFWLISFICTFLLGFKLPPSWIPLVRPHLGYFGPSDSLPSPPCFSRLGGNCDRLFLERLIVSWGHTGNKALPGWTAQQVSPRWGHHCPPASVVKRSLMEQECFCHRLGHVRQFLICSTRWQHGTSSATKKTGSTTGLSFTLLRIRHCEESTHFSSANMTYPLKGGQSRSD